MPHTGAVAGKLIQCLRYLGSACLPALAADDFSLLCHTSKVRGFRGPA